MKSLESKPNKGINKALLDFNTRCESIASKNYFTNVYGFGRTALAFGTLITLLFNGKQILFPAHLFNKVEFGHFVEEINLFFLLGYENLFIARIIGIVILILVISGYRPRITGILHWWVSFSFFQAAVIVDGGDQATAVLTLLLIPITLLDSRKNHWSKSNNVSKYKNFIAYVMFLIIELQVAVIYLLAGIEKPFKVTEWVDGTAVYYWLNHNIFGTSEFLLSILNPLMNSSFFVSAMTWGTIIFELSLFGIFFMDREKRSKFLKFAILFHFTIILFHGLMSFFFAMLGALVLYLIKKDSHLNLNLNRKLYDKLLYYFKKKEKIASVSKSVTA